MCVLICAEVNITVVAVSPQTAILVGLSDYILSIGEINCIGLGLKIFLVKKYLEYCFSMVMLPECD